MGPMKAGWQDVGEVRADERRDRRRGQIRPTKRRSSVPLPQPKAISLRNAVDLKLSKLAFFEGLLSVKGKATLTAKRWDDTMSWVEEGRCMMLEAEWL